MFRFSDIQTDQTLKHCKQRYTVFLFSFAYTTSPAAVMKLVVFFRSSKPPILTQRYTVNIVFHAKS